MSGPGLVRSLAGAFASIVLLAAACTSSAPDTALPPPRTTDGPQPDQSLPYEPGQRSRHRGIPPWRQQGKRKPLRTGAIAPNCSNTSVGFEPLTELGTGTYNGAQGGLYPGGSNSLPDGHRNEGIARAEGIEPLNSSGNPSSTGKYVLLSIGMSNTDAEFRGFQQIADADPDKDPSLVIVNGAQGGIEAKEWADSGHIAWTKVDERLAEAGVTGKQVAVVWLKMANKASSDQTGPFPAFPEELRANSETVAQILHDRFPNLQLAYYSSRIYGGYAATDALNSEPFAYEAGFATKWLVEDQLDGDPDLNFDPSEGAVNSPWIAWGPYMWADGLIPRSDGLVWECSDFGVDGIHPSEDGVAKVAALLLDFFKSSKTASPWFCSGACKGLSSANLSTSLTSDKSKTGYREPFELSGTIAAGDDCSGPYSVALTKRVKGNETASELASSLSPGSNDTWSFEHKSKRSAEYRAFPSGSSGCVENLSVWREVLVRVRVTVGVPTDCDAPQTVRGRVRPGHSGTDVVLKRKSAGKWKTVDRDRLNRRSRFVVEAPTCRGRFKAVWPKQAPDNIRGSRHFEF